MWIRARSSAWPCTHLAQHQAKQKKTWGFTTRLFVPEPHVTCSDTQGSNRASTTHDRPKHSTNNTSHCKRSFRWRIAMQCGVWTSRDRIDRTNRLFMFKSINVTMINVWKHFSNKTLTGSMVTRKVTLFLLFHSLNFFRNINYNFICIIYGENIAFETVQWVAPPTLAFSVCISRVVFEEVVFFIPWTFFMPL